MKEGSKTSPLTYNQNKNIQIGKFNDFPFSWMTQKFLSA